jgi:hypothetical protein
MVNPKATGEFGKALSALMEHASCPKPRHIVSALSRHSVYPSLISRWKSGSYFPNQTVFTALFVFLDSNKPTPGSAEREPYTKLLEALDASYTEEAKTRLARSP